MDRRTAVGAFGLAFAGHLSGSVDALEEAMPTHPKQRRREQPRTQNHTTTTLPAEYFRLDDRTDRDE